MLKRLVLSHRNFKSKIPIPPHCFALRSKAVGGDKIGINSDVTPVFALSPEIALRFRGLNPGKALPFTGRSKATGPKGKIVPSIARPILLAFILGGPFSYSYAQETNQATQESLNAAGGLGVSAPADRPLAVPSQESDNTAAAASNSAEANGSAQAQVSGETSVSSVENVSVLQEGNVTLDFRDADIRNVLRILSYKSGVNIVAGPEVTGLVTIQLTDVPWEEALRVILETYAYGYDRKGNIIVVTTIENLKKRREDAQLLADQEPIMTKTFVLNYAKASEAVSPVDKMRTPRGTVQFDDRTNSIIVRDTASNIALIEKVIPALDATTPQVLIEAKIIETTLSDTEKLGIDWVAKATVSGPKRPTTFPYEKETSKFLSDAFPAAASTTFTYGTIDFTTFQAVLEFLRSRSDTNIISNPRIVTLDNQKASINVGTQYPIPTYTYNEEQAKLQISGWTYMDIGVIFEVTPHVNSAGFVTLDLKPKVTAILDFVTVENTSLPRLSNESAATRVMIKNGETLVIAGLIKDQITDTHKKLPLLGDIPIVGLIFTKKERTVAKTDLLIFMTPHIITADVPPKS